MRLLHDRPRDRLRFEIREGAGRTHSIRATIDVGEGGRLLAIETHDVIEPGAAEPWHLVVSEGAGLSRSAEAVADVELDSGGRVLAIGIPRRGPGYEISWPSGNQ